jgi:hypothetical protein
MSNVRFPIRISQRNGQPAGSGHENCHSRLELQLPEVSSPLKFDSPKLGATF